MESVKGKIEKEIAKIKEGRIRKTKWTKRGKIEITKGEEGIK